MHTEEVRQLTVRTALRPRRHGARATVRGLSGELAAAGGLAPMVDIAAVPGGRREARTERRSDGQQGRPADTFGTVPRVEERFDGPARESHGDHDPRPGPTPVRASDSEVDADTSVRDQLIMEHTGLVKAMARRLAGRLPSQVERSELVSVGMVGLIDAASRFKPSLGVPFNAFARRRIHGAMLDSLRALDWAPRAMRKLRRDIDRVIATLRCSSRREPEAADIARALGVSEAEYERLLTALASSEQAIISHTDVDQHGCDGFDLAVEPSENQHDRLEREEMRQRLAAALGALPDREREVLALYYDQELTLAAIGTLIGVGESRVSQVRSHAIARLRSIMMGDATPGASRATVAPTRVAASSPRRSARRHAPGRRPELRLPEGEPVWARVLPVTEKAAAYAV